MDTNVKIIMAYAIIAIGPILGSYMVVKNSSKLTGALMGGFNKIGKGLAKATTGWAKEKRANSQFAQARAYNKAVRASNRVERQGKMEGDSLTARYNRFISHAAGAGYAEKYQQSATNKAAAYEDKIFKEDKENAAARFALNGIQGPLMVAHARSGRVARAQLNEDGSEKRDANGKTMYEYGRKLNEAEHAAAIEWTMSQGKLEERMDLYGSDWASTPRNPENRRALDALSSGYFQRDVSRFGNTYGGSLGSGRAGGDIGVTNAVLSNMGQGKTAPEALLDNDMAQRLADIGSMSDADLIQHINSTPQLQAVANAKGGAEKFVEAFRTNAKDVVQGIYDTPDLNSRIKPEYATALGELNSGTYDASRTNRATRENAERVAAAANLAANRPQKELEIVDKFDVIGQQRGES